MDKLRHKEYDFSSKLRQASVIDRLKAYVSWKRGLADSSPAALPPLGPVSINLDLTASCNYACPHCVDSQIINAGTSLPLDDIYHTVDTLKERGLLSIILLGGGEPTLHNEFEHVVSYIKERDLQLGIVTNGSRLSRVASIADLLAKEDWLRISLDAATESTFVDAHKPKTAVSLEQILSNARAIKKRNPQITLGYSFVIVWDGICLNGRNLTKNTGEMARAALLASRYSFDYISFKPCLIRLDSSHKESLLDQSAREEEFSIRKTIGKNLLEAERAAGNRIKVLTSVNLRALLNGSLSQLKVQPTSCHMQFFSTVVTPSGIFHCPAFRGVSKARIADFRGYHGEVNFESTRNNLASSIRGFDASEECRCVACFYHHVNWWIENFIQSNRGVDTLTVTEDDNFFL